jgi:hypothetical protein
MNLFFFESQEAADEAAESLRKLGPHARKLLSECVEKQEVTRQKASAAALSLDSAGFIFIRENKNWPLIPDILITPSLAGEEALETLEHQEETKKQNKGKA